MKIKLNISLLKNLIIIIVVFTNNIFAQDAPKTPHHYFTFVSAGVGYSVFQGNNKYVSNLKPLVSYYLTAKEEWQYSEKINFLLGMDFISSGATFNSYYFTVPDSSRIYDNNLNYSYKTRFNQFNVPILVRINYFDKKKDRHCYYTDFGASLQFLIPGRIQVKDEVGNIIKNGVGYTRFEKADAGVFSNLMLNANAGVQFYRGADPKGLDFEINFRYSPNSFRLNEDFSAKDMYFRQLMIGLSAGVRF
jgi:lipoprotein signal peptidase